MCSSNSLSFIGSLVLEERLNDLSVGQSLIV
jgi:hypothetical protein